MTNNALTVSGKRPSYLAKVETPPDAASSFLSGLGGGGLAIPMLSFRGKTFRLRMGGQEVSTKKRSLQVVFVASRPTLSKRYYAEAYSGSDEVVTPRCWSRDGLNPDGTGPESTTCVRCPHNAWGSATRNGRPSKGKACADYKRVVVYPVELASDGMTPAPCVLDVPATSLRAPKGSNERMLKEYLEAVAAAHIPPQAMVVELGFTEAEYPQLTFTAVDYADEDTFAHVQSLQGDEDVVEALFGESGNEAEGPVSKTEEDDEEEEAPRPKPRKAAKPKPAPEPEEDEDEEEAPKPKPRKAKPKPAPEPEEDEDEDEEEASDEDAMTAQILALLKKASG